MIAEDLRPRDALAHPTVRFGTQPAHAGRLQAVQQVEGGLVRLILEGGVGFLLDPDEWVGLDDTTLTRICGDRGEEPQRRVHAEHELLDREWATPSAPLPHHSGGVR